MMTSLATTNQTTSTSPAGPNPPAVNDQALLNRFKTFLLGQKQLSSSSIKNYLSDVNHFLNWLKASIQEPTVTANNITPATIKAYLSFLTSADAPLSGVVPLSGATINRRLASLRRFGQFLLAVNLSDFDPTANLPQPEFDPTLKQILKDYKTFLKTEGLANSTVKNYLSDLKNYLVWAEKNLQLTDSHLNSRPLI